MWKRLDKSGERELKMHPAMPRENARRAILYIPAIKEIYIFVRFQ